ncbi:MAG: Hsp33 family molecular chaperone HslO [Oligoflexia bacterium]|nr:Hsp33 family molecular chaperone HslO [Oligoflexia bacterium]
MSGKIEKFLSADGTVMAASVVATDLINEARVIHGCSPVATAALGRALIGAGLMGSFIKNEGRVAFYFKGDGPLGQLFAEGNSEGHVRGFVSNPQIELPPKNGKLDVGGAVGRGILSVAHSLPTEKQPYTGSVQIQTGEIAEDIAFYLFQSQQIPSIVALGVFVEANRHVSHAGGVIVQVMPGAKEETLTHLENSVKKMKPVTEVLRNGGSAADLALDLLEDLTLRKLDYDKSLVYKCTCSGMKVERSLMLMGETHIKALIKDRVPAEVSCDFCGRKYSVDQETLKALLNLVKKGTKI